MFAYHIHACRLTAHCLRLHSHKDSAPSVEAATLDIHKVIQLWHSPQLFSKALHALSGSQNLCLPDLMSWMCKTLISHCKTLCWALQTHPAYELCRLSQSR